MFVGHTRFSLFDPNSTSWRASNGSRFTSVDEYRQYLFSDERLAPRMSIFDKISLPQIAIAAERHDVRHIISFPSILPDKYKHQLADAAARYSFVELDEQVEGRSSRSPVQIATETYGSSEDPFGMYRLDDDDILPKDFFDQVVPYVTTNNIGMVVSLGTGITALYEGGRYYNLRHAYAPMNSIGLLQVCGFRNGQLTKPVGTAHNTSDRKNAVILDSRRIGFLMTRHISQDTSLGWGTPARDDMLDVILTNMDKNPPVTERKLVDAAFPMAESFFSDHERPICGPTQTFAEELSLSNQETTLPLEPITGTFTLTAEVDAPEGTGANNALVSLVLIDDERNRLMPEDHPNLFVRKDVVTSSAPDIGFYFYLPVRQGAHRVRHTVRLPEGVSLTAASIRRFRTPNMTITVRGLTFAQH